MIKTIRGRLLLSYILLLTVTLLLVGGGLTLALRWFYLGVQERNLTTEAEWVATVSQDYLLNGNTEGLQGLARRFAGESRLRLTVVDQQGRVLADSSADPASMENHADRPEVAVALHGGVGTAQRGSATVQTPFLYVAVPFYADPQHTTMLGVTRVAMTLSDVSQAVHQLWFLVATALLLAVVAAIVISLNLARRITQPIEALSLTAREVAKGNYWHRVEGATDDEIGQLGRTINHMATSIQEKVDEINDAKEQLEFIVRQMTSGVLLLNQDNEVLVINPAARALLGFPGPIQAQHVLDVAKNIELANACQKALESGESVGTEIKVIYPEEKVLQADVSPTRRSLAARPSGIVVVLHDISERKQEERYRAELVTNVSHELRTPVTVIKGFAETLLEESGDPEAMRQFADIIVKEANRLNLLISDILELARIESQRIVLHKETIHLEDVVDDALIRFRSRAAEQDMALTGSCPDGLHAWGDKERVLQVISNFVDNAIKYTPAGGSIHIGARDLGDQVDLTVTDSGIGIPAEDLPRVFERFYRVDKARSRKLGGTGLGLSIVKHLAELQNGRVWLESELGKGTTAHFSLPKLNYIDKEDGSDD